MMKKRGSRAKKNQTRFRFSAKDLFYVLLTITIVLITLTVAKERGWFIPTQPNIDIQNNVVKLDSMTLDQKIAQMVIVGGLKQNFWPWKNMQVGGVHLFALQTEHIFNNTIIDFQHEMPIHFFVTSDLEGCVSPFNHIRNFTVTSDVDSLGGAFEKGFREGDFLNGLGFNLNFAPVVDLDDQIWKCRSFSGNASEIAEFAQAYTLGLQSQGVLATIKHYPGKTLVVKDPHKFVVAATIDKEDVLPYEYLVEKGDVAAIMVSHLITNGEVNTQGVPAVVSKDAIDELKRDFDGLIISDEIHMLGLKKFYRTLDDMYVGVFKAGNDIVLNFDNNPNEVYRMIQVVKKAVERGEIPESQIDDSVTRILRAKGFSVE